MEPTRRGRRGATKGQMKLLVSEMKKRNTNLRFMPVGMAKHTRNTTHVKAKPDGAPGERIIYWHLEVYLESCAQERKASKMIKVDAFDEHQQVKDVLRGVLDAMKRGKSRRRSEYLTCSRGAEGAYKKYWSASNEDLVVYFKNDPITKDTNADGMPIYANAIPRADEFDIGRYTKIDTDQSLRQMLNGRSIVEFPVLHVAFKDSPQEKELQESTIGLFDAPDESDSSGSDTDSDSESEVDIPREDKDEEPDIQLRNDVKMEIDTIETRQDNLQTPEEPAESIKPQPPAKVSKTSESGSKSIALPPPTIPCKAPEIGSETVALQQPAKSCKAIEANSESTTLQPPTRVCKAPEANIEPKTSQPPTTVTKAPEASIEPKASQPPTTVCKASEASKEPKTPQPPTTVCKASDAGSKSIVPQPSASVWKTPIAVPKSMRPQSSSTVSKAPEAMSGPITLQTPAATSKTPGAGSNLTAPQQLTKVCKNPEASSESVISEPPTKIRKTGLTSRFAFISDLGKNENQDSRDEQRLESSTSSNNDAEDKERHAEKHSMVGQSQDAPLKDGNTGQQTAFPTKEKLNKASSNEYGSPSTDTCVIDLVERRHPSMDFDTAFMNTRIPRKRKHAEIALRSKESNQ